MKHSWYLELVFILLNTLIQPIFQREEFMLLVIRDQSIIMRELGEK